MTARLSAVAASLVAAVAVATLVVAHPAAQGQPAGQAAAQAAPAPLVKEGATVKVGDHTWAIPDGNVPLVPNVGIVVGSRATLVIDPGMGKRNGEAVLREVAKVSRNTELYIATTHYHPEHTFGYLAFPASAKYINARAQEAEFAEHGMDLVPVFSSRGAVAADLLKDVTGRKADILFDKDYRLDLGGVTVRFLMVGPTHTLGDTALFVESDNVLFSGDVVMNQSFLAANAAATSMRAWLAAFDTFSALRPRVIVPSHGANGDGSLIATCRSVMQAIQQRTVALKMQGRSADEAAATVQMEQQAAHPGWPRANGIVPASKAAWNEAR